MTALPRDAEDAIRQWAEGDRRHAEPPSLMSRDFDMPPAPSPVPPSGQWEQLVILTAGAPPLALRVWRLLYVGVTRERCRTCTGTGRRGRKGDHCLMCRGMGHVGVTRYDARTGLMVAARPDWTVVARALGVEAKEARAAHREGVLIVSENLGRARSGR